MALEDKARELGRIIGQSDEYRAVTRANEGLANDAAATAVLREMEGLRRDAQAMLERGEEPTEEKTERREHSPIGSLADQLRGISQRVSAREAAEKSPEEEG